MKTFLPGDLVRAHYRSGTYIGKIVEDRGDRFLIEVLAVHKHPLQGDIHHPNETKGVFFHERKALAFKEKMNVKKPAVHRFEGEVPNYGDSLKQAVSVAKDKLKAKDMAFNQLALQKLTSLEEKEYQAYFN
ncbi:kinase-associated lipoprotein B [Virgibacillus sp. MG-45]|uniref:kinase-associated lipoprotein B n=1 Tax=Virgibacillus sp. MG-45 TaxID=3102791 RepID=UPI002ED87630